MTYALRTDPSIQLPLAMNLFEAHHLDGQYLSDKDFLTYQAMLFNLFPTGTRARQWLDSIEYDAEVRRAYASTHRLGVTGVPFLVFQHRYAASGAMGVEEFVKVGPAPIYQTVSGFVIDWFSYSRISSRGKSYHPIRRPRHRQHRHLADQQPTEESSLRITLDLVLFQMPPLLLLQPLIPHIAITTIIKPNHCKLHERQMEGPINIGIIPIAP
jgi:hypothetical protein